MAGGARVGLRPAAGGGAEPGQQRPRLRGAGHPGSARPARRPAAARADHPAGAGARPLPAQPADASPSGCAASRAASAAACAPSPAPRASRNPMPTPPVLAIVAPSFGQLSETFIADHVRDLAPGPHRAGLARTAAAAPATATRCSPTSSPSFTAFGPLDGCSRTCASACAAASGRRSAFDDRMRLIAFLKEQGVTVVLAEFGAMGVLAADACAALGLPLYVYFYGVDASAQPAPRHRPPPLPPALAAGGRGDLHLALPRRPAGRGHRPAGAADRGDPLRRRSRPLPARRLRARPGARPRPAGREEGAAPDGARLRGRRGGAPARRISTWSATGRCGPLVEAAVAETGMAGRVTLHGALGREACARADAPRLDLRAALGDRAERRHRGPADRDRRGDGERAAGGLHPAQRHPRGGRATA